MMVYQLRREQVIKKKRAEVFAFFENPANLEKLTPTALGFKILTPAPVKMEKGAVIDYTIQMLGFPVRWTSFIATYDPPHTFVDIQLKGPYSYWHHVHTFTDHPQGTRIEDVVHYSLPGGPVGRFMHFLFVRKQLNAIFSYREERVSALFGASSVGGT
jgi:ligand-binding SRPBCC domain-containing protein